jgi:hypothetical protein
MTEHIIWRQLASAGAAAIFDIISVPLAGEPPPPQRAVTLRVTLPASSGAEKERIFRVVAALISQIRPNYSITLDVLSGELVITLA